ncbi:MAG: hypothetical protein ACJ8R9_06135 [Steroidobacteraceae bacterium]
MKQILIATVLTSALAACAADTPRVDAQLGKSVAQMIRAQTYDPRAAADPPALAPETGDGQRLRNALDANRKDVPKGSEQVAQPLVFEVSK